MRYKGKRKEKRKFAVFVKFCLVFRARFSELGGVAFLSHILGDQFKFVMAAKKEASEQQSGRDLQLIYETL